MKKYWKKINVRSKQIALLISVCLSLLPLTSNAFNFFNNTDRQAYVEETSRQWSNQNYRAWLKAGANQSCRPSSQGCYSLPKKFCRGKSDCDLIFTAEVKKGKNTEYCMLKTFVQEAESGIYFVLENRDSGCKITRYHD